MYMYTHKVHMYVYMYMTLVKTCRHRRRQETPLKDPPGNASRDASRNATLLYSSSPWTCLKYAKFGRSVDRRVFPSGTLPGRFHDLAEYFSQNTYSEGTRKAPKCTSILLRPFWDASRAFWDASHILGHAFSSTHVEHSRSRSLTEHQGPPKGGRGSVLEACR